MSAFGEAPTDIARSGAQAHRYRMTPTAWGLLGVGVRQFGAHMTVGLERITCSNRRRIPGRRPQ